ncbi:acetyl-CoA synthetase-like protein [Trametes maxima]|nr:acetyl-CoA synthetase-like protein [Trametes maxima]
MPGEPSSSPSAKPTFTSPRSLVDSGKLTIPQLYEWNAKHNPDYPIFRYDAGEAIATITYSRAIQAIRRVARYVRQRVDSAERVPVAASAPYTITYITTALGILRAGYTMYLISPRNGPAGVEELLRRMGCRHVLVSGDVPMQTLAATAAAGLDGVQLHPMPTFEDAYLSVPMGMGDGESPPDDLPSAFDWDAISMILHSSGSTNHPKPIAWTHEGMVRWSRAIWYGAVDVTGTTFACHGMPMFHAIGVFTFFIAATNGLVLSAFKPSSPPTFPTPENVFQGAVATSSDYIQTVPAFVEEWSRDPQKIPQLRAMKGLIFGGAPLKQEVGDALAAQDVPLITLYGSTELGPICRLIPPNPGKEWRYFELNPNLRHTLANAGDGKWELVGLSPPEARLPIINAKVDGVDAYETNDLLEPHPTLPGWWTVYGRRDDQIILSNGEKTNPIPLEAIITQDPRVRSCVVFGQGKFQNGVLVEPQAELAFDPSDEMRLNDYRNTIWPTVERANEFAPQHSRIFKEMILVTSPLKPFTYTMKGFPQRVKILNNYREEIETLYADLEEHAQSDVPPPSAWDAENTAAFLRAAVEQVLQQAIAYDADFFRSGCDSLQAAWIRTTIVRAIRPTLPDVAKQLPTNIIFQFPTISSLTDAILRAVHQSADAATSATTPEDLARLVEEYASNLSPRPAQLRQRDAGKDVVVITGTTGGFGCDVLEHLLRDDAVGRVYAFNRPGSQASERQRKQFEARGLDRTLLDSPKFRMVEAALDVPGFELNTELLDEIRESVTHIMHNAWRVDFNLSLASFKPDIAAVRNLVELSLSSPYAVPPRIQFVSSIALFGNCTLLAPVPEVPMEASSALGSGYGESKWLAERILATVSERAGVPTVVVRLGQVCGNRQGHWNEKEWFPALVKSASFTRCLPDVAGEVSFIPSYDAARAFAEMRSAPAPILHLVHPRPVSWHTILSPIASALDVPLVPYADWLAALERTARGVEAMRENPALRLLEFFRTQSFAEDREPLGFKHLSTEKAEKASEALRALPGLEEEAARRWVAAWRATGFLPA